MKSSNLNFVNRNFLHLWKLEFWFSYSEKAQIFILIIRRKFDTFNFVNPYFLNQQKLEFCFSWSEKAQNWILSISIFLKHRKLFWVSWSSKARTEFIVQKKLEFEFCQFQFSQSTNYQILTFSYIAWFWMLSIAIFSTIKSLNFDFLD